MSSGARARARVCVCVCVCAGFTLKRIPTYKQNILRSSDPKTTSHQSSGIDQVNCDGSIDGWQDHPVSVASGTGHSRSQATSMKKPCLLRTSVVPMFGIADPSLLKGGGAIRWNDPDTSWME